LESEFHQSVKVSLMTLVDWYSPWDTIPSDFQVTPLEFVGLEGVPPFPPQALQRRNMIRVEITPSGEEIWQRGIKKTKKVGLVFAELTAAEADQLDSILNKLAQATQNIPK
jgi:hypothetical protein